MMVFSIFLCQVKAKFQQMMTDMNIPEASMMLTNTPVDKMRLMLASNHKVRDGFH